MGEHEDVYGLRPPAPEQEETEGLDFAALAASIDAFREMVRAMEAGVRSDGYSEDEARAIVAGFFASQVSRIKDEETD